MMNGFGYNANVTGTEFRINDKTNLYGVRGEFALSQQYYQNEANKFGYKYDISAGKFGGQFQYRLSRELASDTYDQNDMGYMRRNNEIDNELSLEYNIYQPFGRFLSLSNRLYLSYEELFEPRKFTELSMSLTSRAHFLNRFGMYLWINYKPMGEKDYYEPRVDGRVFNIDRSFSIYSRFSTDERKKIAVNGDLSIEKVFSQYEQKEYGFEIEPRFRANDKLSAAIGAEYRGLVNNIGYVDDNGADTVYLGMRNSPTWIYTINSSYIFSNKISVSFDLRHYWSRVKYNGRYFFLNEDGSLTEVEQYPGGEDINYNAFTIDMVFKWNFAPGSWMTAVWKNNVDTDGAIIDNYFDNMDEMFKRSQLNSISLKLLYFLDYQQVKKAFKKS
jgi:hypothetical protein